jgi:cytidylate kinase
MNKQIVVAIDGPAGAGKSTVAKRVAARLGFLYIDSGAMYRALALWALRLGLDLTDAQRLEQLANQASIELFPRDARVLLNGEDVTAAIRSEEVSDAASKISVIPGVRRAMVAKQRKMGAQASVVMEGRDIGTVVFPDAEIKIFLDAAPEVRAERRLAELRQRGENLNEDDIALQIQQRDNRDRNRLEAPLMQAPDAVYIDSSRLGIDEVESLILKLIHERTSNGKDVAS